MPVPVPPTLHHAGLHPAGPANPWRMLPGDVPVEVGREQGQRLAELELADPAFRAAQPGPLQRAIEWLVDQVSELARQAGEAAPGGWLGIVGFILVIVIAVLFVRWRVGPVRASGAVTFTVDPQVSAAQYRSRAEELCAQGHWEAATSQRMRALVRASQERALIDAHPGWTADEVATSVGGQLPGCAAALAEAARTFDEVRYGRRPGSAEGYRTVVAADDLLQASDPGPRRSAGRDSGAGVRP
jgi:hypothetical protein